MFYKLVEIAETNLIRMTDTQKAVLLTVMISQTPQLAFDACTGSEYIIASRDFLSSNGLIRVYSNGIVITETGLDALVSNGLIDDTEQTTELGQKLLDMFEQEKRQLMESKIPFRNLKQYL